MKSYTILQKCIHILYSQRRVSKQRGHSPPEYSKQEFIDWCLKSEKFQTLYKNWVASGFETKLAPSIDRINCKIPYSFDNIQVMTWKENRDKGHLERKLGTDGVAIKVNKISLSDGLLLDKYISISEASVKNKIPSGNITNSCMGKRSSAGGFKWEYA